MSQRVIYPGTFDPITNGHLDLIERGAKLFSTLIVGVAASPSKKPLFSLEERVALIREATAHLNNVEVVGFSGLMMDFARSQQASVLLRGVRNQVDFDYELQLASMNRQLMPELETVMLTPALNNLFVSSTLIKEIALHGGDPRPFVPEHVATEMMQRLPR